MTLLIIDIGSSSTRAMLFDEHAQLIDDAQRTVRYRFDTTADGGAAIDPLFLREQVETCVSSLLAHPQAGQVRAVAVASFVGNLMGLDAAGVPRTPIYTYADTRGGDEADFLKQQIDPAHIHQRTGCRIHTAYWPVRIRWLQRTQPDTWRQVVRWVDFATYLYRCWFGIEQCTYSAASWSGMLNRDALDWEPQWLSLLDLPLEKLPRLVDYDHSLSGLLPEYAQRWPILRHVPFFSAVGDGAAANIGSGCVDATRVALTLGTTGALRTVIAGSTPMIPLGLWSYRVNTLHHLVGGATTEGGSIVVWSRELFQIDRDAVEAALAGALPDGHGLTFLPLLAGERSPGWNPEASGTLYGLRLATTPLEIVQAGVEGVAFRLAAVFDQLRPLLYPDVQIIAGGGAIRGSAAWTQIIADALDTPLHVSAEAEVTGRGMAILALHTLDHVALSVFPPVVSHTVTPRPFAVERYKAARLRQQALYERLYN
ncbi:MAG: gluconokinase [bacterium]|nr:gluconokinase [bacterium]